MSKMITQEDLDRTERMHREEVEEYMGYDYPITIMQYEDYWMATIEELPGCDGYGDSPDEAVADLNADKKDWFLMSFMKGHKPPKPKKQQEIVRLLVRMDVSLHLKLSEKAVQQNRSLNSFINNSLWNCINNTNREYKLRMEEPTIQTVIGKKYTGRNIFTLPECHENKGLEEYGQKIAAAGGY
ncbi:type II toxin-antitoxin system HicB family antitoxin [bacterium]|nr:type II toxin-antitoxin system HicB family antitoxin [bacterium]